MTGLERERRGWFMAMTARLICALGWTLTLATLVEGRREIVDPEMRAQLKKAERIYVEALALTERGSTDPTTLSSTVATRLKALGYTVLINPAQPHDVAVKVKCEERKVWEGPVRSGGDADMPGGASRLWKGPACQLTYQLDGRPSDWRHEVRTTFQHTLEAARQAHAADTGAFALGQLIERLKTDPFPYLLTAEWNQPKRLLKILDEKTTPPPQKVTMISLLGNMFAVEALPSLSQAVNDSDATVAQAAAVAIGTIGDRDGILVLLNLLQSDKAHLHLAAAKGLGQLAPLHPSADIVPSLIAALPHETVPVQTEIVRALGKTPDRRIVAPLRVLHRSVLATSRSGTSPDLQELNRALGITLDQFDGVHTNE